MVGDFATAPDVGRRSPVISLKSVVFPVPFRPTIPHRSPSATVNVMSLNNVVAPNSTDAPETDMRVNFDSCFNVVASRNVNEVSDGPVA